MSNSNANPRKRAAPGHLPLPTPQRLPQSYAAPNVGGDQMIKWDGIDGLQGFVEDANNANNGYELVQSQPPYSQNLPAASNSLARRPMNQALVPARPRSNFDTSMPWDGLVDNGSLVAHSGQDEQGSTVQDNVEALEELAQQAKREAQAKRKQIPPFVQKLSSFLEEGKNEDLIRWSQNGDSFIVLDEDEFAKTLIPELFKHNNYASFVRQLNMYGFHKRVGLSDNSMRASERKNKSPSEYSNPYFRRGHPNLLWLINKSKGGGKGKKSKTNDGEGDSEEDGVPDDTAAQASSVGGAQGPRALPTADSQAVSRKEMNHVREELVKMRDQQKLIKQTISRLQQTNNNLYNQALMFQNQHDRHQNSINAILSFLANLFRKSLEDQGNSQSVGDIIQTFIANQSQPGAHQGNIMDFGGFFQNGVDPSSSLGGATHKRTRPLLPPIPDQDTVNASRSSSRPSLSHMSSSNTEMGHITELGDGSPAESSPNIRQELETNPQEQMMRIINDHNATNASGMDLPGAAEFVASAPSLNPDQRNKLANLMARQSASPASSTSNVPPPSASRTAPLNQANPPPRPPQPKQSQAMPPVAPPPPPHPEVSAPVTPSLSPILRSSGMDPVAMHQINSNHTELDQLQRLQTQQDQKIAELNELLGPLSPSGRVPNFDETGVGFDPNTMDFDEYFDFNNTLDDPTFAGVGDDFPTDFGTTTGTGLDTGQPFMNPNGDGPSPADTEEIPRDDFGANDDTADRGSKRRRVM